MTHLVALRRYKQVVLRRAIRHHLFVDEISANTSGHSELLAEMKLRSSPKVFLNYKCDTPGNTVERIDREFKRLGLEIAYRPDAAITGGIPIHTGEAHLNYCGREVPPFKTLGKGTTAELAKASAYAEMAERFCGGHFFSWNLAAYVEQRKPLFLDVASFIGNYGYLKGYMNCHEDVLGEHVPIDQFLQGKAFTREQVACVKKASAARHWVDGYSLTEDVHRKIPLRLLTTISGSNGLAAGNTLEEATVHGICEVFERYALASVVRGRIAVPTVDIRSIRDGTLLELIRFFEAQNTEVVVKDFSRGGRIPCLGVLFKNHDLEKEPNLLKRDILSKQIRVGSHPDPNVALLRCFTEQIQGYAWQSVTSNDGLDIVWRHWINRLGKRYVSPSDQYMTLLKRYSYAGDLGFLDNNCELTSLERIPDISSSDCLEEIRSLTEIGRRENWDIYVVKLSHPVLSFPTVRIVIPGMSDVIDFGAVKYDPEREDGTGLTTFYEEWYMIRNIREYVFSDSWLKSKRGLRQFIRDVEDYLTKYLYAPTVELGYKRLSLFELLAFSNLACGAYSESLEYFAMLKELELHGATVSRQSSIESDKAPARGESADAVDHSGSDIRNCFASEPYDNPFHDTCNCHCCREVYPRLILRLMKGFSENTA